ncbi:uncharacterized protein LOC122629346 isoform X1 [Vespula pensylvanica]|uniref:tRNA (uracil(54)-C(5))-methyltransferase n=1 Tax=Vespula pensylvanica TaxID=30213 RepID=A0A834P3P0_VESPE|nr:uncharacterized protein LOC122629346 isoform X1 [Vespula pensylvanica]KAF7427177.1 hypothetical protein H0235_006871 [Vespula pensylvanica]
MEAVTIEGENYEVVDECLEEDDLLNTQNKLKNMKNPEERNAKNPIEIKMSNSDLFENIEIDIEDNAEIECNITSDIKEKKVESNVSAIEIIEINPEEDKNSIDFTIDVPLDQLNEHKDLTDEEVMHHLDEIENIVLDPTFIDSDNKRLFKTKNLSEHILNKDQEEDKKNIECIDISSPDNKQIDENEKTISEEKELDNTETYNTEIHWYEKKLAEKVATIKERMSKLARVLEFSYPVYQKWLEWTEKVHGSPICKLEAARHCPLDKPHTNRWKFICSRKNLQEVSKEEDASINKSTETVWRLEPTGAWGVNTDNISEFPPFVLRAVKIFENFLQSVQTEESQLSAEQFSSDTCIEIDQKKETSTEAKQQWLWLVVRCNSMDELMLFVTGKNISRGTMDRLKQVYESGSGKDCNVKSLYCKSVNKCNDTIVTNTTFLVGSEALDEIVGGIKIQLAPKTNFWSNPAGAENVAKTVIDLLSPTPTTTVLEVGCGIGLIGLMMASKCRQIIGVDSQSEVEEAEMTCELNNINNASFIMGSPSEVTDVIANSLKNCKSSAIINANTNIGRAIDIMICLRKISSLKRLVMITTLTKQSVRAILELVRPANRVIGNPFMPVKACVVDTLPVGPHFEVIILMERHFMLKLKQPWHPKASEQSTNASNSANSMLIIKENPIESSSMPDTKKATKKTVDKKTGFNRSKGKLKGKRAHSPETNEGPARKFAKKFEKIVFKPWRGDSSRKKDRAEELSQFRINPMYEKKVRDNNDQTDLRERLSNNRVDPEIVNKVKEQQAILDIAKEKLSGSSSTVDVTTAKQLQDMLNMVLEQTNKLQSQLPRSVWDRIAPPETAEYSSGKKDDQPDPLLKGRYIQEIGAKDILITKENKKFLENEEEELYKINPMYKKYGTISSIESNMLVPLTNDIPMLNRSLQKSSPERYHGPDISKQHFVEMPWNRDKGFEKNRWGESSNSGRKQTMSPMRKHVSPMRHRLSPSRRFSPKRPLLSPPRRPLSPPRRHMSPLRRPISPFRSRNSLISRPFSPQNRPMSGSRRPLSPPRRLMSPPRRLMSPPRRTLSPLIRPVSPRRHMSPLKQHVSSMRTITPPRRQISPVRHQISLSKRHLSPSGRIISPSRRDMQSGKRLLMQQERQHQPPMRLEGSFRIVSSRRPMSPLRRQSSPPRRQITPPRRFADDWDIPSRGAIEQNSWHLNSRIPDKSWRDERQSSNSNWDQQASSNRYHNTVNQDKWDIKDSSQNKMRISSGGDIWNVKQSSTMQGLKDPWATSSDNRWSGPSNSSLNNDNWNIRGKESFGSRDESWMDKNKNRWDSSMHKDSWNQQGDKDDWNDLPEDARDPWGDDNSSIGLKERWQKFDTPSTSGWGREHEKMDSWSNQKDNWQNKGQSAGTSKSIWQSNNNQNMGDSRWITQSDISKKLQSSNCQSGNSTLGSWQQQSIFNFQSQRSFTMTQFKDHC